MTNKHPKGLPYLFFTEMWERFGYYLILGIFVLYMTDPSETGGLALNETNAYDIFGTFIALTYLTPFLGGFLADKVLGYIKAIYIGGALMGLGYIGLGVFKSTSMFYASMGLIIVGNGFFKPSISTLLGNLYSDEKYKENKDSGYNIFYMGINIGAFTCNIIAAFMRNKFGWSEAFITAGVGMFIGLFVFFLGRKYIAHANALKPTQEGDTTILSILSKVFVPAILAGILGWIIPDNIFGSDSTDAFIFACIPVILFYIFLYAKAKVEDKKPIGALLAIFAVSLIFWAVFKQNGTILTAWAKNYTNREIPTPLVSPLQNIYMIDGDADEDGKRGKIGLSYEDKEVQVYNDQYQIIKDDKGNPKKEIGKHIYFKNISEERRSELETGSEKEVFLFNTELFQSINPFWVITLTPLVIGFFMMLRRKGKEPSTPGKIVLGMFISSISCIIMAGAVYASDNGAVKVSSLWLIAAYGIITVGELCLSPMGLSLVSKLSPPRITALMMGGFFLSTSIGNKLSGVLASLWYKYDDKANFFWVNFVLLLIATLIGLSILKNLNKILKERGIK